MSKVFAYEKNWLVKKVTDKRVCFQTNETECSVSGCFPKLKYFSFKDSSVTPETIELLKRNIGKRVWVTYHSNDLWAVKKKRS
jgi:hypothetical protein